MLQPSWNVLIVDDEPDVHEVMGLALHNRSWRGSRFAIASAHSAAEARRMLAHRPGLFHVALIDGVMETNRAGFDLCRDIHGKLPMRVVFHSGIYSERYVRKRFGAMYDAFLPKAEVTVARLYETLCSCLATYGQTLEQRQIA